MKDGTLSEWRDSKKELLRHHLTNESGRACKHPVTVLYFITVCRWIVTGHSKLVFGYSELNTYVKVSLQDGSNSGSSSSITKTDGTNEGCSTSTAKSSNDSNGTSKSTTKGTSSSGSSSTSNSSMEGSSCSKQTGKSETKGKNSGTSHSDSVQSSKSEGKSTSVTKEHLNKCAQEWIKYCDDVLFPRIDYGRGKGLFMTAFYVMSEYATSQTKLENTALSLYSGKQGNRVPLRAFRISGRSDSNAKNQIAFMKRFQIPHCSVYDTAEQCKARTFLSQSVRPDRTALISNWISTNELSVIAGLPQREVIGMRLQKQVEFGLNYSVPMQRNQIELGTMVQDGIDADRMPVYLDKEILDKHIFIAGVTGSGKTTTCQKILLQSGLTFLVIEPAKTEYRIMKKYPACENLLVFTLGNGDVAPFRLNPCWTVRAATLPSEPETLQREKQERESFSSACGRTKTALRLVRRSDQWALE